MALILNIDTATQYAGVCLSKGHQVLASQSHHLQKDHAAFLQPAIETIVAETGHHLQEIDAVAVTAGPGSYTGIRVGLASAKGICYALNKPLILVNTLAVIANAVAEHINTDTIEETVVFFPMIDARRMEVFGGKYNQGLLEIGPSEAIILNQALLDKQIGHNKVIFCGDGAKKLLSLTLPENSSIDNTEHTVNHMVMLANRAFEAKNFANLAYAEPFYIKEFYQALAK